MAKSKGMISGFIVGGAVGAVSALLLAPKSGKALREDVSSCARNMGHKTSEVAANVGQYASDLAKSVTNQLPRVVSSASDAAQAVKEASDDVADTVKDNLRSAMKNDHE
ncbi:YtxH domain-containing protein [Gorillibacterium massiliense]|uniref:YtxH domain-containing protein n=1 Tax=Gorillibacterium massiliense TaxID=1280390 RepID=UPI0004B498C3|nr:YtxH domain-containing protein [Gorillibacterium massiliense]